VPRRHDLVIHASYYGRRWFQEPSR
jgi:hypothetical protein